MRKEVKIAYLKNVDEREILAKDFRKKEEK